MNNSTISVPSTGAGAKPAMSGEHNGHVVFIPLPQPKLHTIRGLQRTVSGRKAAGAKIGWSVSVHAVSLAVLLLASAFALAWLNNGYKSTPVQLFRASYGTSDWKRGDNREWGAAAEETAEGFSVLPAVMTAECAFKRTLSTCGQTAGVIIATVSAIV